MAASSLRPAYRVATRRLLIRCWQPSDAPLFKEAVDANRDYLRPWLPWAAGEPGDVLDKVQTLRRFRGDFDHNVDFVYGVFSKDERRVLGGTGLHPQRDPSTLEIGYWIRKDAAGKGLATEAAAALTQIAFEIHNVRRVEIRCRPNNEPSAAIPRKLGFTHEGTLRQDTLEPDGKYGDTMIWSTLHNEYRQRPVTSWKYEAWDAAGYPLPSQPKSSN